MQSGGAFWARLLLFLGAPGARFSCFVLSVQQQKANELHGWTVCVTACVGFWDRYLKEGLGVTKGQCQPSHPLCPWGQWGQTAGGTELCAQAGMYTGGADAKFPPSAFFTRNVLVAAPAMKTAYKWCRMGGRGGPSAFPSSISHHRVPCPDQSFPFPWLLC